MSQERFEQLKNFQLRIKYQFNTIDLLEMALTHRSAKKSNHGRDYEQLEFLGDAVLDVGIAHILLKSFPNSNEGELSKMRAALVNTESLASIGKELQIGQLIQLSSGEQSSGGAEKNSILADVVEALFGAIYLDSNFDSAFRVIKQLFSSKAITVTPKDPKTELQEKLHTLGIESPEYQLENAEGPDHAPTFVSVVKFSDQIMGRGTGATKKASQQLAAQIALQNLQNSEGEQE